MTKILSYNINGFRAAKNKGLIEWLTTVNPEVVCFQEVKLQEEQLEKEHLEDLGFVVTGHYAQKKGYSGVITLSKQPPEHVAAGIGVDKYDEEGRVLRTDFGDLTLLNCYFPSGSSGEPRHEFKMEFLQDFGAWIKDLIRERPKLIITGDYNIVHQDIDIHNPERKDKPSGFRPEERAWLDEWFNNDFTDVFRYKHPDKQEFSWWSYRAGSRKRNKGWRIDYISISRELQGTLIDAGHYPGAQHSDHCPVYADLML